MKKQHILLVMVLHFCQFMDAQKTLVIDSLQKQLQHFPSDSRDTQKVNALVAISKEYWHVDLDSVYHYAGQALELSAKTGYEKGRSNAYNSLGMYYLSKNQFSQAMDVYQKSLAIRKKTGDERGVAGSLHNIGMCLSAEGKKREALSYFFQALRINRKLGNKPWEILNLFSIGNTYGDFGESQSSLQTNFEALKLSEAIRDSSNIVGAYMNIAGAYSAMGNYTQSVHYSHLALKVADKLKDYALKADILNNLGLNYSTMGRYTDALSCFDQYLKLRNMSPASAGISLYELNVGTVYTRLGKYREARKLLQHTLPELLASSNLEWIRICYENLSRIDSAEGHYPQALSHYQQYIRYRDSLTNTGNTRKSVQLQMQYEFDKKQAADSIHFAKQKEISALKLQRQKTITYTGFGIVALSLLLLFFVYRSYQKQQLANRQLKEAQEQLVKSEKMSAFGVMATRVSHEILNPLNFINNFSELSRDLVQEIITTKDETEKKETAQLLQENLRKINGHGKRAEEIVKQLQEHSRKGSAHEFFEENQ